MQSENAYDLGLELFDRYRRHLYGTFTGTIDEGSLLIIEEVSLKASYHHQGIACKAVKSLLEQLNDFIAYG